MKKKKIKELSRIRLQILWSVSAARRPSFFSLCSSRYCCSHEVLAADPLFIISHDSERPSRPQATQTEFSRDSFCSLIV